MSTVSLRTIGRKSLLRLSAPMRKYWKVHIRRDFHSIQLERWRHDNEHVDLRLDYPLTESSVVFDLGGYKGDWTNAILSRYGCSVHVFEPVHEFFENIRNRFQDDNRVAVYEYGLADRTDAASLFQSADSSSMFGSGGPEKRIHLVAVDDFLHKRRIDRIDLMKINIEGGEFDLLRKMIDTGIVERCCNLQIQFHRCCPDADDARNEIRNGLSLTHYLTYDYPFVWENWRRRNESTDRR